MNLPNRNQVLFLCCCMAVVLMIVPERVTVPVRRQAIPVAGLLQDLSYAILARIRKVLPELPEEKLESTEQREHDLELELIAKEAQIRELEAAFNTLGVVASTLGDDWTDFHPLPARILIRNDLAQIAQSIEINVGSKRGVEKNMAVVHGTSIVGVIEKAGLTTSTVRLVNDARFRAAALGMNSRVQGVLIGQGTGVLGMRFVSIDTPMQNGEHVLTSGLDDVFPKGFLLGTIINLKDPDQNKEVDIAIEPALIFKGLESVVVLRPAQ